MNASERKRPMIVDMLLLLNSAVAMALALALLPAVWSRRSHETGARYWAWGCVAIAWSWQVQGWGTALPLDSAALLVDGSRILGITLFAQGSRAGGRAPLNPLWPVGLLLGGYLLSILLPSLWPARGLFVAVVIVWIAWRAGFPLLQDLPAVRRPLGLGFLLYGLLAVNVAVYRLFSGDLARLGEQAEIVIAMLELTAIVYLTATFLVARSVPPEITPVRPTRDAVTGCLDRASTDRRLAREFARRDSPGEPLTVLMIDLDHLKTINDTHGHPAGDEALRAVAATLGRQLRATDALGRYGGDEFVAILPGTTAADANHVVERMRTALAERYSGHGQTPVTVSIGVAQRHHRDSPDSLLARADVALYTAKHRGRNQAATIDQRGGERASGQGEDAGFNPTPTPIPNQSESRRSAVADEGTIP